MLDSEPTLNRKIKPNSSKNNYKDRKGGVIKLKETKVPLHPLSKTSLINTQQNKEEFAVYPSLLSGKMSTQQNITPERKLKGIYLNSPQANTATLPAKQSFQLTNVNSAKFFKARKNSHSKRRAGENESLYEESMKLKIQTNNLKEENLRLKTQIQVTEKELEKRDQLVEEVTVSLNSNMKCSECSLKNPASPVKHKKMLAILKSSLTNNLKKQVKDLRSEVSDLKKEKMDMKNTKVTELNIELNVMKDE